MPPTQWLEAHSYLGSSLRAPHRVEGAPRGILEAAMRGTYCGAVTVSKWDGSDVADVVLGSRPGLRHPSLEGVINCGGLQPAVDGRRVVAPTLGVTRKLAELAARHPYAMFVNSCDGPLQDPPGT